MLVKQTKQVNSEYSAGGRSGGLGAVRILLAATSKANPQMVYYTPIRVASKRSAVSRKLMNNYKARSNGCL